MKKITKSITKYSVMIVILLAFFSIFSHNVFAGPLDKVYDSEYNLIVDADEKAANNPFLPVDMIVEIPVKLTLTVEGRYEELIGEYYNLGAIVEITVNNTPTWAEATITPSITMIDISDEPVDKNVTVFVKVDKGAIPFRQGNINLKIIVKGVGAIDTLIVNKNIPFTPGFFPMLNIKPDRNTEKISPMENTKFKIDIENMGNAKTKVKCKIVDVPKDWTVKVTSNLILGTEALSQEFNDTIVLSVKPSYNFGYHNEREVIELEITPVYYGNDSVMGDEYVLSFVIQNEGFSTPGFEVISIFFALFIVFVLISRKFKSSRSEININDNGRDENK